MPGFVTWPPRRGRGSQTAAVVLDQRGEAEQQAREEQRAGASRAALVGDDGDRARGRQEQDELGVGAEHVVGQEGGAVDQPQQRCRHAAPVVAERGRSGERGERNAQHRREHVHGEQAPPEQQLRQRVVAVEQGRLVVDEVGVQPPAVEERPRSDGVGRLVHVEDLDRQREPARQQADEDEAGEEKSQAAR